MVMDEGLDVLEANFVRHDGAVPEDSDLVAQREPRNRLMRLMS